MSETPETVRKAIEAAKVAVMDLQQHTPLGAQSLEHSVEVFAALDGAWLAACKLQRAWSFGQ